MPPAGQLSAFCAQVSALPLAQFQPLSGSAQWALISIAVAVLILLGIWAHFRRTPPLDSELVKLNAAIDGLQKSVNTLSDTSAAHASHATEIAALQEEVRTLKIHREEDLRAQRTYTRESSERMFKKLDELTGSVNANFQSIERAIGQLEGRLSSTR